MKKRYGLSVGLALLVAGACQPPEEINPNSEAEAFGNEVESVLHVAGAGEIIPGKYIISMEPTAISFRRGEDYAENQALMREEVGTFLRKFGIPAEQAEEVYETALVGFAARLSPEQLSRIEKDPSVASIEPDRVAYLLPDLLGPLLPILRRPGGGGGGSAQPAQVVPFGITRVNGGVSYQGSNAVYVVDTGIELTHPDLNVNAQRGFNAFTRGRDGNSLTDENGHGTHVAGTVGAIDNEIGVIGVAAGAQVIPVKVLGANGSGSNSGVIAGVNFIAANAQPGDVANMSLGGGISSALDQAVLNASNAGIWFVLAAGNSSADANTSSPARVNGPFTLTVSAMDSNDRFASFSNFGNPPIDWCAPGVQIASTWIGGAYRSISGTSMAAPHVAGLRLLGDIQQDGFVRNDPDGVPDPISVR
ncbi:peptidase s8 and s53 subtilisin kexin sedolisin [Nitritalea halalkaliphila LW7]|uniref:Peptidase s8 and s53 subtilisin kexin sedolisin n=1 Tax=Nitritalea halalkaliphila LW7 TaxID=1189621 RepID=I5BUE3_9BACT|nr:S8 family peptidase [Nitritalea halalkaliphila]EIM73195.1 peptidase s8 and s53 subtilisin kexin sedolisin [Nitritalea halalkaliphila LW7]